MIETTRQHAEDQAALTYGDGRSWWTRLNRRLFPWIGPPPVGPYNQPPQRAAAEQACPLCGAPMSAHDVDRTSGPRTFIHCP